MTPGTQIQVISLHTGTPTNQVNRISPVKMTHTHTPWHHIQLIQNAKISSQDLHHLGSSQPDETYTVHVPYRIPYSSKSKKT